MIKIAVKSKFSIDSIYNLISVGLSGVIYILINILILKFYSESILGIFNIAYSIYIIISQLSVFGIHLSTQQYIPRFYNDKSKQNVIVSSSLILVFFISLLFVIIGYNFNSFLSELFNSKLLKEYLNYSLWGIIFFSLNKVFFSYINGIRQMKHFAYFTLTRFLFMILILIVLIVFKFDSSYIILILPLTELILFILLLIYTLKRILIFINSETLQFIKIHFTFGKKAFIGNFLLDINSRVDVLMLGLFVADEKVGIYSFVLAISEGILQIPVVFRNNINPIITKSTVLKNVSSKLNSILKKNIFYFYIVISSICIVSLALFPLGLYILQIEENVLTYFYLYLILISGIIISAGYQPFSMVFSQLNKPNIHSLYIFIIFIVNIIGNYIFIILFDVYGAAIGTALSYITQIFVLKFLIFKYCKLKI